MPALFDIDTAKTKVKQKLCLQTLLRAGWKGFIPESRCKKGLPTTDGVNGHHDPIFHTRSTRPFE